MEAIQHQSLHLLRLSLNLHRPQAIVKNQDSSRDLNSNKMRSHQVEGQVMQTPHRSGSMINSTRYFLKIIHLAHLKLLLRQTLMAPLRAKDLRTMGAAIIITNKTTTQMEVSISSSKIPMISPNPNPIVAIQIRAFPLQATQVATTMEAPLRIIRATIT